MLSHSQTRFKQQPKLLTLLNIHFEYMRGKMGSTGMHFGCTLECEDSRGQARGASSTSCFFMGHCAYVKDQPTVVIHTSGPDEHCVENEKGEPVTLRKTESVANDQIQSFMKNLEFWKISTYFYEPDSFLISNNFSVATGCDVY